jgi:integrase
MGKRANNEGSIYRPRKDGRWVAAVQLGYQNGRRIRRAFYARTQADARRLLRDAREEQERGTLRRGERQAMGDYLEWWLENCIRGSVRPRTCDSYVDLARRHLIPALGKATLGKLTAEQIQALVNEKRVAGLSPRTIHYLYSVLHHALEQARVLGLVSRNLARLVRLPRMTRTKVHPFNSVQARIFLDAIRGNRLETLCTLALACGLRQGEILGLQWSDIDLEQGSLTVRHTLVHIEGQASWPSRRRSNPTGRFRCPGSHWRACARTRSGRPKTGIARVTAGPSPVWCLRRNGGLPSTPGT